MDGTGSNTQTGTRWSESLGILLVFFVIGGSQVPHNNETHYLTKAYHFWHPQWCAGDLFLGSANPHLLFYWTVGALTQWFSLPTVAWVGRFLAWLALAWTWQRLSFRVVPRRHLSIVTAMLLVTLIEWGNFAGEWVVGGVESKCFAYAFVFWALAEMASGAWRRVWPLLGIAAAWHVLVGGWAVLAALVVWWTEPRDQRPSFNSQLGTLLVGGLLALPGALPALLLTAHVSGDIAREADQVYVFERLPHHLAPLTLLASELLPRTARFGALLVTVVWLWQFTRRQSEWAINPTALDRLQRFAAVSIVVGAVGLLLEIGLWNQPAVAAGLLKYYWFRLADVAVPLAVALSIGWLAAGWDALQTLPRGAVAAAILASSLGLASTTLGHLLHPNPPSELKVPAARDWQEACQWVRENTPPNAVFLTPRLAQSFLWHAHRPCVCNWKDVPQDAAALVAWHHRYQDIFTYLDPWGERQHYRTLGLLGADRLQALAEEYHFDYVLTEEYPPVDLPVVLRNDSFTLYRIPSQEKSP